MRRDAAVLFGAVAQAAAMTIAPAATSRLRDAERREFHVA